MSFTRFHDDQCRVKKSLQESTGPGRYMLNQPGWGAKPCYFEDPHIRLQQWGANLLSDSISLENNLMGLNKTLTRDCVTKDPTYEGSSPMCYPTCKETTSESRTTDPVWKFRELEQVQWSILPLDPQENVCIPFQHNLNTRILEKDYFLASAPCCINDNGPSVYSAPFSSTSNGKDSRNCMRTNTCGQL